MLSYNKAYEKKHPTRIVFFLAIRLEHGGGAEKFVVDTCKIIAGGSAGCEIRIVTAPKPLLSILHRISVAVYDKVNSKSYYFERDPDVARQFDEFPNIKYYNFKTISELRKLLDWAEVIYTRNEIIDLALLHCAGIRRNRCVIGVHTPLVYPTVVGVASILHNWIYRSALYSWMTYGVKCWHVLNEDSRARVRLFSPNVPIAWIPYALISINTKLNPHGSKDSEKKSKTILWAARMEVQKGADILPSIVRYTCEKDPHLSWIILGSGTLLDEVRASLVDVDRAQVLGNVPETVVWDYMLDSEIFVSTSRWECWPNTIMSALQAGPNIVATNIPGHVELLSQQAGAFLCDDVNQIGETLLQIDSRLVSRLPGRYTQRFSNEEFFQNIMRILN